MELKTEQTKSFDVEKILDKWMDETPVQIFKEADMVNHPPHYEREGAMECIDEMLMVFGTKAVMDFCLCNAWKYRYRAANKNGMEDIKKSDWYMAKYKELLEQE